MREVQKVHNLNNLADEYRNCFHLTYGAYPDLASMEMGQLAQVLKRSESFDDAVELVRFYFTVTDDKWITENCHSLAVLLVNFNKVIAKQGLREKSKLGQFINIRMHCGMCGKEFELSIRTGQPVTDTMCEKCKLEQKGKSDTI